MHLTGELVSETVEPTTVFDEDEAQEETQEMQQEAQEAHAGVWA